MPLVTCANPVLSNAELFGAVIETNFAEIPAITNNDCMLVMPGDRFFASQKFPTRPDKTPTLSRIAGRPGKREARWSVTKTLAGSGTPGTVADDDQLWHAAFGQAATITASTKVAYSLQDATKSLSLFSYYNPSAAKADEIAYGCIVDEVNLQFGGEFTIVRFSGPCFWVTSEGQVTDVAVPALAKGTLTSWPAAPGSPVYVGTAVAGDSGYISIDGVQYNSIQGANLNIKFNRVLPNTNWNNQFPGCPRQGIRQVTLSWTQDVNQDTNLTALLAKIAKGQLVPVTMVSGDTTGNTHSFILPLLQIAKPARNDSGEVLQYNFSQNDAVATTPTSKDEVKYEIT